MLVALALAAALADGPQSVRGDFDHDGKPDLAEIVYAEPGVYQLVIRRGAKDHPVAVIDTFKREELRNLFLDTARPGRWPTWCGKGGDDGQPTCRRKFVDLRGDTLSFGMEEASEAVALWTGKKFEVVWLSD